MTPRTPRTPQQFEDASADPPSGWSTELRRAARYLAADLAAALALVAVLAMLWFFGGVS